MNRPLWDTEVNYGDRREGMPQIVPDPQTAATYVARTYLDSATLGIGRTYWYGWDLSVLGIDMVDANGITPAGTAFVTVRSWLTGARPAGCWEAGGLRRCAFTAADGTAFTVVWATGPDMTVDATGMQVCRIDGTCVDGVPDQVVSRSPVLLKAT
ncbi:MAG: hypothetical protein E6Q90_13115 [Actinobacteria bacterium]|nr:MAG: hypothetical protein E6Q90_13115 [Actinomycetota bacterium]